MKFLRYFVAATMIQGILCADTIAATEPAPAGDATKDETVAAAEPAPAEKEAEVAPTPVPAEEPASVEKETEVAPAPAEKTTESAPTSEASPVEKTN